MDTQKLFPWPQQPTAALLNSLLRPPPLQSSPNNLYSEEIMLAKTAFHPFPMEHSRERREAEEKHLSEMPIIRQCFTSPCPPFCERKMGGRACTKYFSAYLSCLPPHLPLPLGKRLDAYASKSGWVPPPSLLVANQSCSPPPLVFQGRREEKRLPPSPSLASLVLFEGSLFGSIDRRVRSVVAAFRKKGSRRRRERIGYRNWWGTLLFPPPLQQFPPLIAPELHERVFQNIFTIHRGGNETIFYE